jgi:hypothetical protein
MDHDSSLRVTLSRFAQYLSAGARERGKRLLNVTGRVMAHPLKSQNESSLRKFVHAYNLRSRRTTHQPFHLRPTFAVL